MCVIYRYFYHVKIRNFKETDAEIVASVVSLYTFNGIIVSQSQGYSVDNVSLRVLIRGVNALRCKLSIFAVFDPIYPQLKRKH